MVEDLVGLLDALGLDRVVLLSLGIGPLPLFAATHPERTVALVVVDVGFSSVLRVDGETGEVSPEALERNLVMVRQTWGTDQGARLVAPKAAADSRFRRWFAKGERVSCTADEALWRLQSMLWIKDRAVLRAIKVPTLVVSRPAGSTAPPDFGPRRFVDVEGAKHVEIEGDDFLFFVGDTSSMLDAIEAFVTGELPQHALNRVLATVMFTDIVGSTDHLARVGDRNWKATLTAHDDLVTGEIERHRGRQVKTTGDGVLATFDGPGRAVRCAQAVVESVRSLGIEVRAGVHTGEIELRGDDVGGIGVHIAARVASLAGPSEVLVSRTVTDLVAGSGIEFEDRGEQELKGVPGSWRVYSVLS
ncbi:MAG: adenylate/guanylate cyclase domain-containing protein [Acidimicrobiales bacterium]